MDCRPGCGACCIAPSISTPMPGHPRGKAAGVACVNLTADLRCALVLSQHGREVGLMMLHFFQTDPFRSGQRPALL